MAKSVFDHQASWTVMTLAVALLSACEFEVSLGDKSIDALACAPEPPQRYVELSEKGSRMSASEQREWMILDDEYLNEVAESCGYRLLQE